MSAKARLTDEVREKIWEIKKRGMKNSDIAYFLGISVHSVERICAVCEMAENNDIAGLHAFSHITHAQWALNYFGLTPASVFIKTEEKEKPDNTNTYLINLLNEVNRTNELLIKLCKVWGVDE